MSSRLESRTQIAKVKTQTLLFELAIAGGKETRVRSMPVPTVKDGKWSKERERTKSGRWRKKRSDANEHRKKHSNLRHAVAIAAVGTITLVFVVIYLYFPDLLRLPW